MVTPPKSQAAAIVDNAIKGVFIPAMQRHTARELPAHLGLEGGDWLGLVIRDMRGGGGKETKAEVKRGQVNRLVGHTRAVDEGQAPEAAFETNDFKTLAQMYPEAFPRQLCQRTDLLDSIQTVRNDISHPPFEIELAAAKHALATCETVLKFINDEGALNTIRERQGQLNSLDSEDAPNLADQDEEPRSAQSEDATNLAEHDGGPRDAQSEDAPNLAGQGDEPRDRQPEGATSLAGQDGGPPARRTGGGVDLTRLGLYVTALGVLIAVVLLVAFTTRSGNGPLVCGDIGDVELTGPGDPNGTVALDGYCTGADDDELTFSAASSDNDIVSAAVEGDLLTLTAGDGNGGTATITVTATDPDGRSAPASFGVTVNPPNRRPDCDDVEDVTVVEGDALEIPVSCSDLDGDTITLRVSADSQTDYHRISPSTASIDGSGTHSFTIAGHRSSAGASYVEIEADDGKGGTDMVRFSVVVDADEDERTGTEPPSVVPPEIEGGIRCAPSPVAVNAGVTCEVSLSKDGTPPFTYEWRGGSSSNTTGGSYSTSFGSEGSQTVSLTVSNDGGSDDASTTVQVMEVPTINSLGCPSSATENQAVTCSPSVSGTGPFTYRWSGGGSSGSSSTYSPSWSAAGTKTVSLTVANAVGSDNGSTSVVVDEDVRRPEINSIICESPVATNASANCRVNLSGGAPDSYSWSDSDGGSGNDASYHPSFSSPGSKTVSLTVRNTADSDSESTTVRVMTPPTINSLGCPSSVTENEVVTCSPTVSGTGPFTYGWSDGESVGVQSSYSLSWSTIGVKTVWLSVLNDVGDDQQSTTVYVNGEPRCDEGDYAIVFANDGGIIGDSTTTLDLNSICNDPDGDSLSYTVEPRSDSDDSVATGSVSNGVLTIYERGAGDTTIWVTVQDGRGGSTEVAVPVDVAEPVDAGDPEILVVEQEPAHRVPTCKIEGLDLVEGTHETLYLADHCVDHSGGNMLTFEAELNNSSVVSLDGPDGRRGSLEVNADGGGQATITIRATDSAGRTGVAKFTVEVTGDVTCSLDPDDDVIRTSLTRDPATYTYALRCEDPTGARLSYTSPSDDNNVADASYDGNTLTISIRGQGATNIYFTATAPDGRSWEAHFVVYVNR